MKKMIKIFASVIVLMTFAVVVKAQSADDVIAGKATVFQVIVVDGLTDLEFGNVSPGLTKTIGLENDATGGQVGEGTETTGVFSVSAAAGSDVQLQFTTLPANLVGPASATLPIGTYTAGYDIENPFDAGSTFTPGTGDQVSGGNFPTNDVSGVNLIYVFLGATVTPGASQAAGDYEADITLTATYN